MSLADRSLPLDPRGERQLDWLAGRCAERLGPPDLIVSSSAVRALVTARVIAEAFGCDAARLRTDERLYGGWGRGLPGVLATLEDEFGRVTIVGHNPALSQVVRHLAPTTGYVPSGALAALAFDVARWSDIAPERLASACLHAPVLSIPLAVTPLGGMPATRRAGGPHLEDCLR